MTIARPSHGGVVLGPTPPGRYGFNGVLASEWTKLISVRSTVWTLLVTAIVGVGLGAIVTSAQASRWSSRTIVEQLSFDPARSSLAGLLFAQLAIGVLGVLVVSSEYSTSPAACVDREGCRVQRCDARRRRGGLVRRVFRRPEPVVREDSHCVAVGSRSSAGGG